MTVAEERAYALRMVHPELRAVVETRGYGLLAQAVFFVLTGVGVAALLMVSDSGVLTAAVALALAEFLMAVRKWFYRGVEAALWLGGLLVLLFELPSTGKPEALLLVALCFAAAAWRVRQPLFGVAAAVLVTYYLELRLDLGTVAALAFGLAAIAGLFRTWRRPSTEWLFALLVMAMPIVAGVHAGREWIRTTLALAAGYAAIALACAMRKPHHALFAGSAAAAAVAVVKLHQWLAPRLDVTLAVSGAVLLALSLAVSRALRLRTRGLVLTPVDLGELGDAAETLGTFAAGPVIETMGRSAPTASAGNPPEPRPEGGGGFGGAGATGDV